MRKFIAITLLAIMLAVFVSTSFSLAEEDTDDETFTIIWISDTQDMAYHGYDHVMQKMGAWIFYRKEALNIKYVVQTGDAVDNGASPEQWEEFNLMLHEFKDEIPYIGVAGNHEVKKNGYREYLMRPEVKLIPRSNSYMAGKASYCTLEVNECKLLIIAVGYGVEEESSKWVNSVLKQHKDHSAILLYHDYLQTNRRFSITGKSMYRQIVLPNPNVRLVLCGHVCDSLCSFCLSSRVDLIDDNGDGIIDRTITQMMYNYQKSGMDNGQLRILEFNTSDRSITVSTYSPVTKRHYRDWTFGNESTFVLENAF